MLPVALWLLLPGCSPDPDPGQTGDDTGGVDSADSGGDSAADDTGGGDSDPDDSGGETGGDTGVTTPCSTLTTSVKVAEAAPTVFTVEWATEGPTTAHVEWGYDATYGYATLDDSRLTTDHQVVVAGPAEGTTVHWRAVSTAGDVTCTTDDQTLDIAAGDGGLPPMALVVADPGFTPGFRVMAVAGSGAFLGIIDDQARLVWSTPIPEGYSPLMGRMDVDATHLLFLLEDEETRQGLFIRASLDQSSIEMYDMPYAHHAFTQLPDGSYTFIEADPRELEGRTLAGDALVHYDAHLQGADALWSTWDEWTPNVPGVEMTDSGYYPDWLDWTHGNGIALRSDGSYLFSMHNISKIANVGADGTLRWSLSGIGSEDASDLDFDGAPQELFENQHSPSEVAGGVLVFDNGYTADHSESSEAAEYEVDEASGTFRRVWSFDWTGSVFVQVEGDAQRLANGNTLITWGSNGSLTEVTPEGEVVWEATMNGQTLGFMEHYASIGGSVR